MIETRDYDIKKLGKRARCIPGAEPVLSKKGDIIPVCEPDLDSKALEYVIDAVNSNWISSRGQYLDKFEKSFAQKVGADFAVSVNSGTSALHLALASLGIKKGDEVIIPAFTMVSTAFAVSYLNAKPVFVDCDKYYQINPDLIEEKITSKTKAILPVSIYGHPTDCDKIEKIAKKYNLEVIYDNAEAHGALYKGKPIGGRGLASCYSFYSNKIICAGEAGMVVGNNKDFIDIVRNLKDVAFSTERHFWHKRLGYNFRLTNLAAAIGVSQVERFDELVKKHQLNAEYYINGLKDIKGLKFPQTAKWATNVFWMTGLRVLPEFRMTRDELRKFMADRGIETRTFFVPLTLQPYYQELDNVMPNAELLSEQGLYLPSSSKLVVKQMDRVIEVIKEASCV